MERVKKLNFSTSCEFYFRIKLGEKMKLFRVWSYKIPWVRGISQFC